MGRPVEEALAVPNVLEIDLVARPARWEGEKSNLDPGAASPTTVEVLGFSEEGGSVTIPGPMHLRPLRP